MLMRIRLSYAFGKILALYGLCHPEAKPKYLVVEWEVSGVRSPDLSLRCAAFKMTDRARINQNPYQI